jgi:hypothetical protein
MRMSTDLIESIRGNQLNPCHPRSILNICVHLWFEKEFPHVLVKEIL